MGTIIRFLVYLALARQILYAQQLQGVSQQRFKTESGFVVEVENLSDSELTAFEAHYRCNGRLALEYHFDALTNLGKDKPIPKGIVSTYRVPSTVEACQGGVIAVLFADGHSEGNAAVVSQIRQNRQGILTELQYIASATSDVTSSFDANGLIDALKLRLKQVTQDTSLIKPEKEGRMFILDIMIHIFTYQTLSSVPPIESAVTIPSVRQMAKASNLPMMAAHAAVMHLRVQQWISVFTPQTLGDVRGMVN